MTESRPRAETRDFDIYLPATEESPAQKVETIQIEVFFDEDGDEIVTLESRRKIDQAQARHRGLIDGSGICKMRERYHLTQKDLAALIGCAEKSLSRWENGKGFPTGTANRILRLLDEGFVSPASLKAVTGPRHANAAYTPTMPWTKRKEEKPPVRQVGSLRIAKTQIFRASYEAIETTEDIVFLPDDQLFPEEVSP